MATHSGNFCEVCAVVEAGGWPGCRGHQQAAWSAPGEIPNTGIELMTLRRE